MKSPRFIRESPAMRCVGYRQAVDYLLEECTREAFLDRAKAATRQLAKRQMTWLRSMKAVTVFDPYAEEAGALAGKLMQLTDAERG